MWHSDTISLTLSRCCLHTPAPTCLHIHTATCTHRHANTHTHTMFFFSFSRCSTVCICVTDTAYVCMFTSHLSKNVFQLCNDRCNMRTYCITCLLLTNAVFHHTHRHTQNQKHIDKLTNTMFLYYITGASITTISKPSPRGPSWETLSYKPCKQNDTVRT